MLKTDFVSRTGQLAGAAMTVLTAIAVVVPVRAQDTAGAVTQAQSKPATPPKAPAQKAAPAAAPSSGASDSSLRQRVEQLEEQIVDMQVVIGTLESFAKAPPPSASAAPSRVTGAGPDPRVDRLESQLQALTAQMQQMSNKSVPGSQPDRRSEMAPAPARGWAAPGSPPAAGTPPPAGTTGTVSSFGSTTVTADQPDPIAGVLSGNGPPPAKFGDALPDVSGPGSAPAPASGAVAALAPADGGDPQQAYSSAYGFLLGQNYGAAQAGFEEFLRRHPKDALAPDALFWLGEAHYMQKNYKDASDAFDLVTSTYSSSAKAPEAQLRRAASLVQLGRKDDACAALRQLNTKYPNARPVLKTKAEAERQRAGCA